MWVSAQGRPVYDGTERFPKCSRVTDARVTPMDYDTGIAYGDYYLYIIQSILAELGTPMIHRLPPTEDGGVPDMMLFYAGDEDATPGVSLRASEIMHERGLPYQINLMPAGEDMTFTTTPEECAIIRSRGHRLSFHYNMVSDYPWCEFTEENFKKQYEAYLRYVGDTCVSSIGHCGVHVGWADRNRFQEPLGIMGDSSRFGEYVPGDINPFNTYGFVFGVSYPFFLYDDHTNGNRRINLTDIHIAYIEPRIGGKYTDGKEIIERCLNDAAYFGRIVNLFTHPHYLAETIGYETRLTFDALDEVEKIINEKKYSVIHSIPDKVCLFWHGRDKSVITSCKKCENTIISHVECAAEGGIIVRFPIENCTSVKIDGKLIVPIIKKTDGRYWLMVPLIKRGGHIIEIIK